MQDREKDFQAAAEIGKVYNSFIDKKLLCDFFLESTSVFIGAEKAWLFLAGNNDKLWQEADSGGDAPADIAATAQRTLHDGKNLLEKGEAYIPLIVRNSALGVACFSKNGSAEKFNEKDVALASDLTSQLAASLKNIFLFEDNLRMERLATIGQTMSAVMHELKNILQLASLSHEFLKIGLKKMEGKSLERGAAGIEKALKEMDGFTYEILSLTKDYKIQPQPIELQKLFDELRADVLPKAEQWQVKLDFTADPSLGTVYGEPKSLYRAILNLVKNAIEVCDKEDKSYIRITAKPLDAERYEIRIEDNGKGMSDEVKARIFQAFFSTKGEKGTGLGLLIVDKTIKGHYGDIRVESELGKGTSFIITLPKVIKHV